MMFDQAIMSTAVVLIGLTMVGLLIQILNQIRLLRLLNRVQTMEDQILARLLMEDQTMTLQMTMEGTPVTMEDLILRDLEEHMAEANTMETMETIETIDKGMMITDITHSTPEKVEVVPTENQTAPIKTSCRAKGKVIK